MQIQQIKQRRIELLKLKNKLEKRGRKRDHKKSVFASYSNYEDRKIIERAHRRRCKQWIIVLL